METILQSYCQVNCLIPCSEHFKSTSFGNELVRSLYLIFASTLGISLLENFSKNIHQIFVSNTCSASSAPSFYFVKLMPENFTSREKCNYLQRKFHKVKCRSSIEIIHRITFIFSHLHTLQCITKQV